MRPPTQGGGDQTVTSATLSTVGPATEMYSSLPSLSPSWVLDASLYMAGHSSNRSSLPSGRFIACRSRKVSRSSSSALASILLMRTSSAQLPLLARSSRVEPFPSSTVSTEAWLSIQAIIRSVCPRSWRV
eukprot:2414501-Pyramimonas_sp.AAC.1